MCFVPFPGASAEQVESLVASPMEQVLGEIAGVKHIYSTSTPGLAVLTVQFEVGEPRTEAIVRLYNAIYSNQDWRPAGLGVLQPLVRPGGIDDVPMLALTLWTRDPDARRLGPRPGGALDRDGDQARAGHARRLHDRQPGEPRARAAGRAAAGRTTASPCGDLAAALQGANVVRQAGALVGGDRVTPVQVGRVPRRSRRRRGARGRRTRRQARVPRGRRGRCAIAPELPAALCLVRHRRGRARGGPRSSARRP